MTPILHFGKSCFPWLQLRLSTEIHVRSMAVWWWVLQPCAPLWTSGDWSQLDELLGQSFLRGWHTSRREILWERLVNAPIGSLWLLNKRNDWGLLHQPGHASLWDGVDLWSRVHFQLPEMLHKPQWKPGFWGPGVSEIKYQVIPLEGPNRIMHQQPKHIDGECMLGEKKKHLQNNGHALIEDKYKKKKKKNSTAAACARTSNCCRTLCSKGLIAGDGQRVWLFECWWMFYVTLCWSCCWQARKVKATVAVAFADVLAAQHR